jgi:hypothetical protein
MSLNMIKGEFGGVTPIKISEYYRGGPRVSTSNTKIPASGVIKWSDFYGGTACWSMPRANFANVNGCNTINLSVKNSQRFLIRFNINWGASRENGDFWLRNSAGSNVFRFSDCCNGQTYTAPTGYKCYKVYKDGNIIDITGTACEGVNGNNYVEVLNVPNIDSFLACGAPGNKSNPAYMNNYDVTSCFDRYTVAATAEAYYIACPAGDPSVPSLRKTYTPGTYNVLIPTGVYSMKFVMVAGGGGGGLGGSGCGGCSTGGSGGGGGGYQSQLINVTPNETLTLIVGAAGAAGGTGGTTTLKRGGTVLYTTTGGGPGGANACRCWGSPGGGAIRHVTPNTCAAGGTGGIPNGGAGRKPTRCDDFALGGTSYSASLGYGGGSGLAGKPGVTELWW